MAINPLMLFASLSVATVGGIVVVQQVNKSAPIDRPAIVQKQVTPLLEPVVKTVPDAPIKKLASIEPKAFPPAKLDEETLKNLTPIAPSFDVVRVEQDGGAVVVGKAAPNARISLKLNGKVIGKTKSNSQGDWVFIPDQLIPSGSHQMVVESTEPNKKPVRSKQSIFIAIAKNMKDKPLVVVSTPNAPTKVLQVPDATPTPVVALPEKTKIAVKVKTAAKVASNSSVIAPPKPAVKKSATTIVKQALAKPVLALPKTVSEAVSAPTKKPETPVLEKPVVAVTKTKLTPHKAVKTALKTPKKTNKTPKSKPTKLVFGTVDYNDQGNIVFSGKAAAGKTVRLYIDNEVVGDAVSDENGNWVFKGKRSIQAGLHELRADQLSTTGKVTQRTAVPFVRAAARKVAALIKKRGKAPAPAPVPATKTAKEPVKAVVVPETDVAPKVEVKQPVIANKTPEPKQELVSHVVIQPGNNLWNISRVIYGKGVAYTTIYQANKTQIKNPHRIYPGQILETPGAMSTGSIGPDERGDVGSGGENG